MKKRLLALLTILCLLTGCTVSLAENVGDSLVVGMVSTRTTEIRPLTPQEAGMVSLYNVVYESLVTVDDNGIPQPYLAEKWEENNSGETWTFTLRENLRFSDGSPLTADDVVASAQYLLTLAKNEEAEDNGFYQTMRYTISSISKADERTVIVKAARKYYGVLYSLTFPVVPAAQVEQANPLGSGPYVISAFEPGSYMQLDANANWWQTQPQVRQIMASFFSSNKELITAYEYGRVDTAFTRSVAAAQYKSGISSLSIAYNTRQMECLLMNHQAFPMDSLKVRQAIRYAINVNQISNNVYMGMTLDSDAMVPSNSWLYDDSLESTFVYNPDKARQLLEEDGWTDLDNEGPLDKIVNGDVKHLYLQLITYEDPDNDVRYETANLIEEMLAEVGIGISKNTAVSYQDMQSKLQSGAYELALCAFQMDVVPDYGFMLRKGNTGNYMRYVSNDMTNLIDQLRDSENQTDFAYASMAIQQQFANDVPLICLFYRTGSVLTRKMYTTVRNIREFELLRGIEAFGR